MGLDMYLSAELYLPAYSGLSESYESYASTQQLARTICKNAGMPLLADGSVTVRVPVAYWRKANQIHGWMVHNVQSGEDECREHDVSWDTLVELREICRHILDAWGHDPNHPHQDACDLVEATLPPQPGFFFGSYEIDEWYHRDLTHTVEQLDQVEKLHRPGEEPPDARYVGFIYRSSW